MFISGFSAFGLYYNGHFHWKRSPVMQWYVQVFLNISSLKKAFIAAEKVEKCNDKPSFAQTKAINPVFHYFSFLFHWFSLCHQFYEWKIDVLWTKATFLLQIGSDKWNFPFLHCLKKFEICQKDECELFSMNCFIFLVTFSQMNCCGN